MSSYFFNLDIISDMRPYRCTSLQETLQERGLDFKDLANFDWNNAMVAEDDRKDYGETRYAAFGFSGALFVGVVYTIRQDAVRIISLRKASNRERKVDDPFKATD